MRIDRPTLKARARNAIANKENHALLASIAVFLLLYAMNWLFSGLSGYSGWFSAYYDKVIGLYRETGMIPAVPYSEVPWPKIGTGAMLLCAVILILRIVLNGGYESWCLQAARGQKPQVRAVFDGFTWFGRVLILQVVRGVLIGVGTLFFIVPGVWLFCRYRLALYAFFDDPDLGVVGALRRSAALTRGHIMEVFLLALSFIGWLIAAEIVAMFFIPVLDIWVRPYTGLTFANYYDAALASEGEKGNES